MPPPQRKDKTSHKRKKKQEKNKKENSGPVYIARSAAQSKLQLSLKDFRTLCVYKGIYPHEPKKRNLNKVFYYTKDIKFLALDPLLPLLREKRIWKRKVKAARLRGDTGALQRLEAQAPVISLDHVIKERYPTFEAALRDLDDALSTVHLFVQAASSTQLPLTRLKHCAKLCREFEAYVIRTHSLKKVFVSIKGIYYQAVVSGETISWLAPHQYRHTIIQKGVDTSVMVSFLDLYETLLGFVLFKLFKSIGLRYPPPSVDEVQEQQFGALDALLHKLEASLPGLSTAESNNVVNEQKPQSVKATEKRIETIDHEKILQLDRMHKEDEAGEMDEESTEDKAFLGDQQKLTSTSTLLFSGCKFFLGRETPQDSLYFVIRSFCGEVASTGKGSFLENDQTITHHIVDRGYQSHQYLSRCYVQPQWVYDCINEGVLLPTGEYAPNAVLPPHLSPFVDYSTEGEYVPAWRQRLDHWKQIGTEGYISEGSDGEEEEHPDEGEGEDEEDAESEDEVMKEKISTEKENEEEEKELPLVMLTGKKRRLYEKMVSQKQAREEKSNVLTKKRKLLKQEEKRNK